MSEHEEKRVEENGEPQENTKDKSKASREDAPTEAIDVGNLEDALKKEKEKKEKGG